MRPLLCDHVSFSITSEPGTRNTVAFGSTVYAKGNTFSGNVDVTISARHIRAQLECRVFAPLGLCCFAHQEYDTIFTRHKPLFTTLAIRRPFCSTPIEDLEPPLLEEARKGGILIEIERAYARTVHF